MKTSEVHLNRPVAQTFLSAGSRDIPVPCFWLAVNWRPESVFSAMVGMARCAVPARVVAGGKNIRSTLAFKGIAPLHAARTSQRDVPTTLNTYGLEKNRRNLKAGKPALHRLGSLLRHFNKTDCV